MRILHVVRQLHPSVGGLEAYVLSMAKHQQKQGHVCEILTLDRIFTAENQPPLPHHDRVEGVKVRRVGFMGRRRFFVPFIPLSYVRGFDVVHVHNTDGFFDGMALLSPFIPGKMVATSHGGFFHTQDFSAAKYVYFRTVTRLACLAYDRLIATSENDWRIFSKITGDMILQPNAVEPLGDFTAHGEDFVYIGRLSSHKKVDRIIGAFAYYSQTLKGKGKLHLVGPEWDVKAADLKTLAARLHVEKHVLIHGFVSPAALQKILKKCGYFVSASLFEGFGMSLIEAMSVGLVPIVQPNESFKVLIRMGGVGNCLDFSDARRAGEGLKKFAKATDPAREMARKFAATFSWEKLAAQTLTVYEKIGRK